MHEVTSADGTTLAVEAAGSGPVLVLVGGVSKHLERVYARLGVPNRAAAVLHWSTLAERSR